HIVPTLMPIYSAASPTESSKRLNPVMFGTRCLCMFSEIVACIRHLLAHVIRTNAAHQVRVRVAVRACACEDSCKDRRGSVQRNANDLGIFVQEGSMTQDRIIGRQQDRRTFLAKLLGKSCNST